MELDEHLLAEIFPVLDQPGHHTVRIDFRAESGRGALAQIRFDINDEEADGLKYETPPPAAHSETSAVAAIVGKVLAQNEKLLKHVMESTAAQAATQMGAFESMSQMMMLSMERDRERHSNWSERNERDREFNANRIDALAANHSAEQKELYSMLMAMQQNNNGGGGSNIMSGIQDHITARVMETLMEKFDGVLEGAGQGGSPAAQILGALGPVLAEKLSGAEPAGVDLGAKK